MFLPGAESKKACGAERQESVFTVTAFSLWAAHQILRVFQFQYWLAMPGGKAAVWQTEFQRLLEDPERGMKGFGSWPISLNLNIVPRLGHSRERMTV